MKILRILKKLINGEVFSELVSLIRLKSYNSELIVFYCSDLKDEIYIRSSYKLIKETNKNTVLIISSNKRQNNLAYYPLSISLLKFVNAKIIISPSTGVGRQYLPSNCKEFIHMPHSLVSMNMVYDANAIKSFTRFFVCGNYQSKEIQEIDKILDISPRPCKVVGYGKSDEIIKASKSLEINKKLVVMAPSWGKKGLLETLGIKIIEKLLNENLEVCLRPHPAYLKEGNKFLINLKEIFKNNDKFFIEDSSVSSSLDRAALLISDYSGVSFEYIFMRNIPTLFVDVELKINNKFFQKCKNVPVEVAWREDLGTLAKPIPDEIVQSALNILSSNEPISDKINRYKNDILWDGKCSVRVKEEVFKIIDRI